MTVRKKGKRSTLFTLVSILVIIGCLFIIRMVDKPGRSVRSLMAFGEQYLSEGDYEHALTNFRDAIGRDPENADAYLGAAKAYEGLGKRSEALELLDQGYEAVPDGRLPALKEEIESGAYDKNVKE